MGQFKRILGVDLGIASCGWAAIEIGDEEGQIVGAGVRCFDAPLTRLANQKVPRGEWPVASAGSSGDGDSE